MTFLRWLFAIVILAPFALPHVIRDWPKLRPPLEDPAVPGRDRRRHAQRARLLGLNYTTATNGVILNSFIPVMIITFSWVFLRERLTRMQLAGVGVSLAGVFTILSRGSIATLTAFRLNGGDLLVILSMAMWSSYTVCLRWRPPGLHMLTFLFVLMVVGDLCMLPFFLGELAFGRRMAPTARQFRGAGRGRALFVGAGLHLLEPGRRRGGRERGRAVRPPDAGVRRGAGLALSRRAACAVSCRWNRADPDRHLDDEPAGPKAGAGARRDRLSAERRANDPRMD